MVCFAATAQVACVQSRSVWKHLVFYEIKNTTKGADKTLEMTTTAFLVFNMFAFYTVSQLFFANVIVLHLTCLERIFQFEKG